MLSPGWMTNEDLAKLLGTNVRTIERYRLRGLTPKAPGETAEAWIERAKAWRRANRKKPGPQGAKTGDQKDADLRYRLAKAEIAELDLAERRGDLHSKKECEGQSVRRFADLRAAFSLLPQRLARRAYQAPSPETIQEIAEAEVRRCLELLANGEEVEAQEGGSLDGGDEGCAPMAGAPDGQRVGRSKHRVAGPRGV